MSLVHRIVDMRSPEAEISMVAARPLADDISSKQTSQQPLESGSENGESRLTNFLLTLHDLNDVSPSERAIALEAQWAKFPSLELPEAHKRGVAGCERWFKGWRGAVRDVESAKWSYLRGDDFDGH